MSNEDNFDMVAFWKHEHDFKVDALGKSLERELVLKNELLAMIEEIATIRADNPDDDEPLTPEWLVERGGEDYPHHGHVELCDINSSRVIEINKRGDVFYTLLPNNAVMLAVIHTRGDFRALVSGLKFPVKGVQ